jgi:hypothetical protein
MSEQPPITPLDATQAAIEEAQASHENYIQRLPVAVDIAVSEITGGPQDETISTRLAIDAVDGHGLSRIIGKEGSEFLDHFAKDHGADAACGDLERSEAEEKIVEGSGIIPKP